MNPGVDFSQLPLRDIHLPGEVAWWPLAPGWWLLLALGLGALAYVALRHYRYRRQRAALRAIAGITARLENGDEPVDCLRDLSSILRRFVMTIAEPGEAQTVPGLTGPRWLDYLDAHWTGGSFRAGAGRMLLDAPYAPQHTVGREQAIELTRLCADWVTEQRPQAAHRLVAERLGLERLAVSRHPGG